jgi:hypothetical protein
MWHTTSYNRYNGEFVIVGGAIQQSNEQIYQEDDPLSEYILYLQGKLTILIY